MYSTPNLKTALLGIGSLLATLCGQAQADDLVSTYLLALDSDPQYQAAVEAHRAALEVIPQSRAALLPNIAITGDVSRNRFDPRNRSDTSYSTNQTYSISLRQALYQRERFLQLEQADNRVVQADAQLVAAQQNLLLRVATRYFLVLGAQDNVAFPAFIDQMLDDGFYVVAGNRRNNALGESRNQLFR